MTPARLSATSIERSTPSTAISSALVGQGQALSWHSTVKEMRWRRLKPLSHVDPSVVLGLLARRVEVLPFRGQQQGPEPRTSGSQRWPSGRCDSVVHEPAIADSPDSAILYRELGGSRAAAGRTLEGALEHFRKAIALSSRLMPVRWSRSARFSKCQNDFRRGRLKAYADALAAEPDPAQSKPAWKAFA